MVILEKDKTEYQEANALLRHYNSTSWIAVSIFFFNSFRNFRSDMASGRINRLDPFCDNLNGAIHNWAPNSEEVLVLLWWNSWENLETWKTNGFGLTSSDKKEGWRSDLKIAHSPFAWKVTQSNYSYTGRFEASLGSQNSSPLFFLNIFQILSARCVGVPWLGFFEQKR